MILKQLLFEVVIQPPQPAQPPQPGEKIVPKKKKPKFRKTIEGKVNVNRFKNLKANALKKKFAKSKKINQKSRPKASQNKTSQKLNNFNQKLFNKKFYENKKQGNQKLQQNQKPALVIKKTPQKRNYLPVKPIRPELQKIQQKDKDVKPITGKINIVILDMTWSEMAYWLQARTKLTNLMYNAPGKVITGNKIFF